MTDPHDLKDELIKLAGRLSARPISPESYKLDELLTGLESERARLGQRRFVVALYQQHFDYDGLTDYLFLLDSFETQAEAEACVESRACTLLAMQTAIPDTQGDRWVLESEGEIWSLPMPTENHMLRALHDRTYKLRASPYDTKYNCFRVIGPFNGFVVCDALFEFVNARSETWHYFVEVGEAIRAGKPRPAPH